ncbi:MAG TPA: hypothetical protein VFO57_10505, partial [Burkholderiales bacterium]|nr:hypothetical protein [Burkholderiales bacterium]
MSNGAHSVYLILLAMLASPAFGCKPMALPLGMTVEQYADRLFAENEAIVIGRVVEVRQPP